MLTRFSVRAGQPEAARAASVFVARLAERGLILSEDGAPVMFSLDTAVEREAFRVEDDEGGGLRVVSGGLLGLLHGAGWVLRQMTFTARGALPCARRGEQKPRSAVRGMYFASHFHNYYHMAPIDELTRYLEDLALWGVNYLMTCYPMIDLARMEDPESARQLERHADLYAAAHALGMRCASMVTVNGGFQDYPRAWKAAPHNDPWVRRGDAGNMLCLAKPGVQALMDRYNAFLCEGLARSAPDMFIAWPYDEGGCGCPDCAPWGAKGFLRGARRGFEVVRSYFPQARRCLSTWMFDTPYEGEWEALTASLAEERWCDMILADAHNDFPRYPLEQGVPGGLPLLNFPEISMWGLFPWGGWGATMLPQRYARLYAQTEGRLDGGFPYSEGVYEDINKAVVAQLYWHGGGDWRETLRQYARYELGIADPAPFLRLVECVEKTQTDVEQTGVCALEDADEAYRLARSIDEGLPDWAGCCWRWRIVLLRTLIDARRYRIAAEQAGPQWRNGTEYRASAVDWKTMLADDAPIQQAFRELIRRFHCSDKAMDEDPYHGRVRPVCD